METFVHCAVRWWTKLSGARNVLVGQPLLGIFLLVPLIPAPANLCLGELACSVQGHQASKKMEAETKSRIQTLPKEGEQYLVVGTKIREWVERRSSLS